MTKAIRIKINDPKLRENKRVKRWVRDAEKVMNSPEVLADIQNKVMENLTGMVKAAEAIHGRQPRRF